MLNAILTGEDYLLFWVTRKAMVIGTCLAVMISWGQHHSLFQAIWQGALSWLYVGYWAFGF
jgi:hypothetical protein